MSTFHYVKNFIKDKNVASITPTSKVAVERICKRMDFDNIDCLVEYGPGGGVFTKYILDNMRPDAKLIAVDLNKNFINALKRNFPDPRLHLFHDSAENVVNILDSLGECRADYIISGIPFSFFDPTLKRKIIANTKQALKPGGSFIIYNFPPILKNGKSLRGYLGEQLENVKVDYQILNIPPLWIYQGFKPEVHNMITNGNGTNGYHRS